jgi:7-carboxy-7-deazaguanine synthase
MEKALHKVDALPLMEAFYTLQGEGYHRGKAAYFIRLGGCDVGCHWCDVKESWDVEKFPRVSVQDMVKQATEYPGRLAVVTGGEPFMHNLSTLTDALAKAGFSRNIETSGAYPISGDWEWICFSPKKFKAPLEEFYQKAHELKVVIYHPSDLAWAESFVPKMNPGCKLFLQPEWGKSEKVLPLIIEYIKNNPHWEISLQIHKFMNIP